MALKKSMQSDHIDDERSVVQNSGLIVVSESKYREYFIEFLAYFTQTKALASYKTDAQPNLTVSKCMTRMKGENSCGQETRGHLSAGEIYCHLT